MRGQWILVGFLAACEANNAFKMSPQDKSFGDVAPGSVDKFNAPQKAPSAKDAEPVEVASEEDDEPKVVDDFNPARLGKGTKTEETRAEVTEAVKEDAKVVADTADPKAGLSSVKGGTSGGVGAKSDDHALNEAHATSEDRKIGEFSEVAPSASEGVDFGRLAVACSMIIFSELGDKTFFIAALFAMRHAHWFVFSASFGALAVMTILSAILGRILPSLLSPHVTTALAALLFFVFGAKMVSEGLAMDASEDASEEMHEVEHEIEAQDNTEDMLEKGLKDQKPIKNLVSLLISPLWIQIFVMTFLGEWGDRSQIATIAMGAGGHYWEVVSGSVLGHGLCTLLAIASGKIVATKLSLRTITLGGAACFFLFGFIYTYDFLHR